MKTKLFTFLVALFMMFTIYSCDVYTYTTTQDDIYVEAEADIVQSNVSFDIILQYGRPHYMNGTILYYFYNNVYYYPFYYNNYWYVRAYRRPFTHFDHRPYFRPHRYDHRFSPGYYRGYNIPNNYKRNFNPYNNHRRPDVQPRNPNSRRPDVQPRNPNNRRPDVQSRNPNNTKINSTHNNIGESQRGGGRR